jgi:hypothetical protein
MFRNPLTQLNGLEKIYKGEFEQDPSADYVIDIVDKFNHNVGVVDTTVGKVLNMEQLMLYLRAKGLFDGFLHGGSIGPKETTSTVASSITQPAVRITDLFVTPMSLPGAPPLPEIPSHPTFNFDPINPTILPQDRIVYEFGPVINDQPPTSLEKLYVTPECDPSLATQPDEDCDLNLRITDDDE